ncbi:MBL fold metallo-hydrolase [Microvirga sp. 17 mud 1-3]|uniref:MBL fold metallo-hydrolase n=1 Tax=Microvirga sp. 17 mud 1-3 TaxID=2082949 RepID=UPI000D6C26B6|nr:MBL fold metallo-hydrolase [Microvirga sp. 17 mud 1-3]AWM88889.1 MBL fold metallo-hydrolase [Microvirga sp. 17 mud 1-3]
MVRRAASSDPLQIRFWGTRGSTCASGPRFVEFGSHTACVEVRCGERLFVVDAGSGLSALGTELGADAPAEVDLLLSHLHLDHICGLPFFKPALLSCNRVIRTYCGNMDGESAEAALNRLYAPPLFPVSLDQLPARFEHRGFKAGETLAFPDGARVATHRLNHPGGATGYRFDHGGRVVCYISDLEHSDPWPDPGLTAFVRDADLMIYDGMFSEAEYSRCRGWGHSTWEKGVELAKAANVKSLAIFHLYPGHDDTFLKDAEAEMQKVMPSAFVARERQTVSFAPVTGEAVAERANPAKVPAV